MQLWHDKEDPKRHRGGKYRGEGGLKAELRQEWTLC